MMMNKTKTAALALVVALPLALGACTGGSQVTGCEMYNKLSWLITTAETKFAGKYAADVAMAVELLRTGACTSGDWQVRAEAVAVKLTLDLWQIINPKAGF